MRPAKEAIECCEPPVTQVSSGSKAQLHAAGMEQEMNIEDLRSDLIRQEETIIFALIERGKDFKREIRK
jgi:hypothetical protein